jgi:hypothetical protein
LKNFVYLMIGFLAVLSPAISRADLVEVAPVAASTGTLIWAKSIYQASQKMLAEKTYPATGYRECAEVQEIKNAFLCGNYSKSGMAQGLGRASAYIEGIGSEITGGDPIPAGQLLGWDSQDLKTYGQEVEGFDLKGPDLMKFYAAVQSACATSADKTNICLNDLEREIFEKFLIPHIKNGSDFVVITFPLTDTTTDFRVIVSHELMHAQYFLQPDFRDTVDQFWNQTMSEAERASIRTILGALYDGKDELLMRNEFQAYILMSGAEMSQLANYVGMYREPLIKKLAEKNLSPVQVH